MPSIVECIVVQPPTSAEVRARMSQAIEQRQLLPLTLIASQQEVPAPEPFNVTIDIKRTTHPDFGDHDTTIIEGWSIDEAAVQHKLASVVVNINADPAARATASLVTD